MSSPFQPKKHDIVSMNNLFFVHRHISTRFCTTAPVTSPRPVLSFCAMSQQSASFSDDTPRQGRSRRPHRGRDGARGGGGRGGRGRSGGGGRGGRNMQSSRNAVDNADWFKERSSDDTTIDPWAGPKLLQATVPSRLGPDTVSVLWLRNDLRLADNPALTLACTGAALVPLYVLHAHGSGDDTSSPWGFARVGRFRTDFIKQSLTALRTQLQRRGSDMCVVQRGSSGSGKKKRNGAVAEEVVKVVREIASTLRKPVAVIAHKETTWEETEEEKAVQRGVRNVADELKIVIDVHFVWTATMHHPDDLPFNPAGPALPPTFTAYRKWIEKGDGIPVREELPVPARIPPFPAIAQTFGSSSSSSSISDSDETDHAADGSPVGVHPNSVHPFPGGETAAMERVREYVWDTEGLAEYKDTRNLSGRRNNSSKFSPWLALGCLSARTVYWNVKRFEAATGGQTQQTYWMIFELMTRDYFRWISACVGTKLFALNGFSGTNDNGSNGAPLFQRQNTISQRDKRNLLRWIDGQTGAPFVDASMRELKHTGFMSNRGRQNVASFLVHDLYFPDWRAGAEYFEQVLIDHDVAVNWGNWAYVAGVGADPRAGRRFNVIKQSMDYEPDGWYIRLWCPELANVPAPMIHEPHVMSNEDLARFDVLHGSYPKPITRLPSAPNGMARSLAERFGASRDSAQS